MTDLFSEVIAIGKLLDLSDAPVQNICQAFFDSFVEANVKKRNAAGYATLIIRREIANCCAWCKALAGVYKYEDAPRDVYRRHDNCRCMVLFETEKRYSDVWSKIDYKSQREARLAREKEIEREIDRNAEIRRMKKLGIDIETAAEKARKKRNARIKYNRDHSAGKN